MVSGLRLARNGQIERLGRVRNPFVHPSNQREALILLAWILGVGGAMWMVFLFAVVFINGYYAA